MLGYQDLRPNVNTIANLSKCFRRAANIYIYECVCVQIFLNLENGHIHVSFMKGTINSFETFLHERSTHDMVYTVLEDSSRTHAIKMTLIHCCSHCRLNRRSCHAPHVSRFHPTSACASRSPPSTNRSDVTPWCDHRKLLSFYFVYFLG